MARSRSAPQGEASLPTARERRAAVPAHSPPSPLAFVEEQAESALGAGPGAPTPDRCERGAEEVQFVALVKEDVEALWQQLHKDGQQPAEWTKEQLAEAVTSVQNTKHRKTEQGSMRTGGSTG